MAQGSASTGSEEVPVGHRGVHRRSSKRTGKLASGLKRVPRIWKYKLSDLLYAIRNDPSVNPVRKEDATKIMAHIQKEPGLPFVVRLGVFRQELPRALGLGAAFYGTGNHPASGISALDVEARGCELARKYGIKKVDLPENA